MAQPVCVVGSFMADLVVRARRRPERGETVVGQSLEMFLGGKGFNQAVAAARAGAATAMVGTLGDDEYGQAFTAAMARDGIDSTGVRVVGAVGTGVAFPVVEDSGDNSIIIIPRANESISPADVRAAAAIIERSSVLLLQLELPVEAAIEAAKIARDAGVMVVLNPAPAVADVRRFAGLVDLVVPNETEAFLLANLPGEGRDLRHLAACAGELQAFTGAANVVITAGDLGAFVATGEHHEMIAAHDVACIDTVGAGDAFCGAMAALLASGATLAEAVRYGNAAGALATTRAGAEPSMPTLAAVQALLASTGDSVST